MNDEYDTDFRGVFLISELSMIRLFYARQLDDTIRAEFISNSLGTDM